MQYGPFLLSQGHESHKKAFHEETKNLYCHPAAACCAWPLRLLVSKKSSLFQSWSLQERLLLTTARGHSPSPSPCSSHPPPSRSSPSWTNSHSSHPCDEDPGATGALFTTAGCKRSDGLLRKSGSVIAPGPVHTAALLFSVQAQYLWRKCSWQAGVSYIYTQMMSG